MGRIFRQGRVLSELGGFPSPAPRSHRGTCLAGERGTERAPTHAPNGHPPSGTGRAKRTWAMAGSPRGAGPGQHLADGGQFRGAVMRWREG